MDVSANKGVSGDAFVVGVDFGTLSARALVVRVSDGTEAGTAVSEYPHGVMDSSLAGYGELPPDWALQDPADYTGALAAAVPAAIRDAGIDPGQVIGIATDFTASTCMPVLADGTPLCQLPGLAARPHAYPKLWKHHAAQPHADRINAIAHERGEKWINRYGGKISSEWQFAKALQLLEEDFELYQRADRWIEAADWIIWQLCGTETRNACTAGYKGIFQDGQLPVARVPDRARPALRRFRRRQARPSHLAARCPGRGPDPGGSRADRAARGHRGGRRQRGRARHRARRRPGRGGQDGGDHGYLDLPRDERRRSGRGARHVRGRRRRHRGRVVGIRGGAERGRRHLRLVRPERGPRRVRRRGAAARRFAAAAARREGGRPAGRRARAYRAGLGGRQPLGAGGRPPVRRHRRPDAGDHGAGDLPRAARVDRVRHQDDHRDVRRLGRAGHRARRGRRPDQERPADADLRGRHPAPAVRDRVRAGPGARLGHPRGGRRGRLPGRPGRGGGHGPDQEGRLPAGPGPGRRLRRAVRRVRAAARLFRARGEPGHAPAARHPRPGRKAAGPSALSPGAPSCVAPEARRSALPSEAPVREAGK